MEGTTMKDLSRSVRGTILPMAIWAGLSLAASAQASDGNLILNPGFETARGSSPIGWRFGTGAEGNTFEWVRSEAGPGDVHSGGHSLRMNALRAPPAERSMDITSNSFRVPPHARVEAAAWVKANDVVSRGDADWYGLRVTLTAYSEAGVAIEHRDLLCETGSFCWRKIQGGMIAPEGTATMDLSIKMTTCTGTVWVDDAEVRVAEELPAVDLTGIRNPVLIPHPWQAWLHGGTLELRNVAITNDREDPYIHAAVDSFFTSVGVAHEFSTGSDRLAARCDTQMMLGDRANPVLTRELSLRFPDATWTDLGEQGYFLAVIKSEGRNQICVGANTHLGRFYALQTLKQLTQGTTVWVADILDKPTVARRGIPMGLHWFEQRSGEALQRLTQLKFNFVWVQGSMLDDSLSTDRWRLDFTAEQKAGLQQFLELYRANFIEVWMALGPRGKNPPLQYSSDADIHTVVRKMDVLYTLGLRNFGLRFDDLANVGEDRLLVRADIETFDGDIGRAQVYFIREVHGRLKALHPDIQFMVVPMDYNQAGNHGPRTSAGLRLQRFRALPAEIGIYSVSYYDEDILAATGLTGRAGVAVVSNFYSEGIEDRHEYAVPYLNFLAWQDAALRRRIVGFTWLPKIPQCEDAALISWHTAADFAWAPERYEPGGSFQWAAARYLGVPDNTTAPSGSTLP
jgi:hypothetical protein